MDLDGCDLTRSECGIMAVDELMETLKQKTKIDKTTIKLKQKLTYFWEDTGWKFSSD